MNVSLRFLLLASLLATSVPLLFGCGNSEPPLPYALPFEEEQSTGDSEEGSSDLEGDQENSGDREGTGDSDLPVTSGYDGDPCAQDSDCLGGFCIPDPDWPDGYCTTLECVDRTNCNSAADENACLQNPQGSNFCIRLCDPQAASSCRQG